MMRKLVCTLATTACLFAAEGTKRPREITTTERLEFAPGGTIRVDNSFGYLTIEGWDEPAVQITVTRYTDRLYESDQQDDAKRHLDLIQVSSQRLSPTELAIKTTRPSRHGTWSPPLPPTSKAGVTVDYRILAPHDSKLVIHHDTGYVWIAEMTRSIEARSHSGDMTLMLPAAGRYSIDARTRLGDVASDFDGIGKSQFLVGQQFTHPMEEPFGRIFLRMGRGKITIRQVGPRLSTDAN
jgi:hypothetical protein